MVKSGIVWTLRRGLWTSGNESRILCDMSDFTNNHYVPKWHQRRFMAPGQGKYHYLDLSPEVVVRGGHDIRATLSAISGRGAASRRMTSIQSGGAP
jgi:hypothetical protein